MVYCWTFRSSARRQKKKSKSLFCVVLRAFFTACFFYVLNCSLNLLAVLSSFQLHKRFLSDPGPNRNNLLLSRLDRCLSGWCCYKIDFGGMPFHCQLSAKKGLADIWHTVKYFQYNGLDGNWKSGPGNGMNFVYRVFDKQKDISWSALAMSVLWIVQSFIAHLQLLDHWVSGLQDY